MAVHRLPLTGGHVMHVEEHGQRAGLPALVLHGGPGSGGSPLQRSFFDPAVWRILCPDQRGAGLSTPRGSIAENTLGDLLADLRVLREHLGVDRWIVVGGSWGATLALLHALDQPEAVAGLVLRNPFLAREEDIARLFSADGWGDLQRQALPAFLADLFATGSPAAQRDAATRWWQVEQRLAGGDAAPDVERLVDRYRVQSHYLRHGCWIAPPLLEQCARLPSIPILVLQGTEDRICAPEGAEALAHALGSRATLRWVPGAGHDPGHPAMAQAMREALRDFAARPR
jgi:proline iminopeptidase